MNKNEVKNMLEKNLGLIDRTIRLDFDGLCKILKVSTFNLRKSLVSELTQLHKEYETPLIDIISCKNKDNALFKRLVRDIAKIDGKDIVPTNTEALLFIEGDKMYMNEVLVSMMCSRYNTFYRYVIIVSFREVVENLKKAGLRIQGLEDITAANIYKDVTKQYLDSVKEIFIEKYKSRMTKGGSISERENYWRDYKYNLLENIAATNEMLNRLFNDDFEEEINELHDEV